MPLLKNPRHERFCQLVAGGMPGTRAYRKVAGARAGKPENDDVHSHEWSRRPDVKARIQELMAGNAQRAQMTREELLAFYADVIRTPADSVPSNSRIIQAFEKTEHGRKIRLVDKAAAGAALAKMCGWDQPTKIVVTTDPLLAYLKEIRATPINGGPVECEPRQLEAPLQEETFDESQADEA
jgi:Terminase small subunit